MMGSTQILMSCKLQGNTALIPWNTWVLFWATLCQRQLESSCCGQSHPLGPLRSSRCPWRRGQKPSTNKILENIKSSKGFMTPNCTFSPALQTGGKGRKKTNDFREKVEACHEPEVNLSWAGLLLNSSQLSFALQGPPAPKPPALYQTFSGSPWGWGK